MYSLRQKRHDKSWYHQTHQDSNTYEMLHSDILWRQYTPPLNQACISLYNYSITSNGALSSSVTEGTDIPFSPVENSKEGGGFVCFERFNISQIILRNEDKEQETKNMVAKIFANKNRMLEPYVLLLRETRLLQTPTVRHTRANGTTQPTRTKKISEQDMGAQRTCREERWQEHEPSGRRSHHAFGQDGR